MRLQIATVAERSPPLRRRRRLSGMMHDARYSVSFSQLPPSPLAKDVLSPETFPILGREWTEPRGRYNGGWASGTDVEGTWGLEVKRQTVAYIPP